MTRSKIDRIAKAIYYEMVGLLDWETTSASTRAFYRRIARFVLVIKRAL